MPAREIRFDDGAAYENYMGKWSQKVGETFLDFFVFLPRVGGGYGVGQQEEQEKGSGKDHQYRNLPRATAAPAAPRKRPAAGSRRKTPVGKSTILRSGIASPRRASME